MERLRRIALVCLVVVSVFAAYQRAQASWHGLCDSWIDNGGFGACFDATGWMHDQYENSCDGSCGCYCLGVQDYANDNPCGLNLDRDWDCDPNGAAWCATTGGDCSALDCCSLGDFCNSSSVCVHVM